MESKRGFERRVEQATGVPFRSIPRSSDEHEFGAIVAKRGDVYVTTSGYPDVYFATEEDDAWTDGAGNGWLPKPENFRVFDLSGRTPNPGHRLTERDLEHLMDEYEEMLTDPERMEEGGYDDVMTSIGYVQLWTDGEVVANGQLIVVLEE